MSTVEKNTVKPFYIFLSGGEGVGKSHTLITAYHAAIHTLRDAGQDPSQVCALLTAPTGTAAFNIGGMTIHSALHLPVRDNRRMKTNSEYLPLGNEIKNTLKCKLQNLKLLIIDEISMVGAHTLINVHKRLQEIKDIHSDTIPFGGISVMVVGDLMQLPPVGDSAVFANPSDPMQRLNKSLWEHFQLLELTEGHRQKGDPEFASILNRIRIGTQTPQDLNIIASRVDANNNNLPSDCLSIYPTNVQVDSHNQQCMSEIKHKIVEIKAQYIKPKGQGSKLTLSSIRHQTGGLHETLAIAVGAQVSIVKNIDTADGLVNGAMGTVVHIAINPQTPLNGTIFIHFSNAKLGIKAKLTVPSQLKHLDSVPITAVTTRFMVGNTKTLYVERLQYPLTLAWSATIHKVQGQTLDKVVVSFDGGRFTAGQAYVALSRAKSLAGLYLRSFSPEKIRVNKYALAEMERLQHNCLFQCKPNISILKDKGLNILLHLNIRSFPAHDSDFMVDKTIQSVDLISMTETYLDRDEYQYCEDFKFYNRRTLHGITAFVRKSLQTERLSHLELISLEAMVLQIEIQSNKMSVVVCYKPPKQTLQTFKDDLILQIERLPLTDPVILLGDFNSDLNQQTSLATFLSEFGFQQYVTNATHRFGGFIDHIYTRNITPKETGTCFCYYSDHTAVYSAF